DFGNGHQSQPEQLRVGEASVTLADGYISGDPPPVSSVTVYPENMTANPPVFGSARFYDEILTVLKNRPSTDVIFYIHGYDTEFKEGLQFAAQLQHNINAVSAQLPRPKKLTLPEVQVVIFSWPSEGRMVPWISYFDDRSEARLSQVALARAIGKLKS